MKKQGTSPKRPPPDNFARVTAIMSLLIAVIAILLPLVQETRRFKYLQAEDIVIHATPSIGKIIPAGELGAMGRVFQLPWKIVVSNIGNRPLSIIRYDLFKKEEAGHSIYSGLDGGFYEKGEKKVYFPFQIGEGESNSFLIYIGVIMDTNLAELLDSMDELTLSNAGMVLARHKMDLFGNQVNYQEYGDQGEAWQVSIPSETIKQAPQFILEFRTSRGNVFSKILHYYSQERPPM